MLNVADTLAVSSDSLFCSWAILQLPGLAKIKGFTRLISLIMMLIIILFVPVYSGFTLVNYFRGCFGDLSITTGLILLIFNLRDCIAPEFVPFRRMVAFLIILLSFVLYLSFFGFMEFDIYSLGFYPGAYIWLFASFILVIFLLSRMMGFIWLCALIAFYYKLQYSLNLWNYLLDPGLILLSIYTLFDFAVHKFKDEALII